MQLSISEFALGAVCIYYRGQSTPTRPPSAWKSIRGGKSVWAAERDFFGFFFSGCLQTFPWGACKTGQLISRSERIVLFDRVPLPPFGSTNGNWGWKGVKFRWDTLDFIYNQLKSVPKSSVSQIDGLCSRACISSEIYEFRVSILCQGELLISSLQRKLLWSIIKSLINLSDHTFSRHENTYRKGSRIVGSNFFCF